MIIDAVSDLHGFYPELEGGDLLIVAGDLTARDEIEEYIEFNKWLSKQNYKLKIVIAGNHDNLCEKGIDLRISPTKSINAGPILANSTKYLCDSGTEFEGLKIWGSPWTLTFKGMNPHCKAFTVDTEEELAEKWVIPDDVDILVTHSPPFTILDYTIDGRQVGSSNLLAQLIGKIKPKLHVFGHIHEDYGQNTYWDRTIFVNASHVNEHYQPKNPPIRVTL